MYFPCDCLKLDFWKEINSSQEEETIVLIKNLQWYDDFYVCLLVRCEVTTKDKPFPTKSNLSDFLNGIHNENDNYVTRWKIFFHVKVTF